MSAILLVAIAALVIYNFVTKRTIKWKKQSKSGECMVTVAKQAPGPVPLPVFGSLHLLGKRESPFQSFTDLSKTYGDIYSLTLGTTPCLVVNNLELIKEVLNQNGKSFGGRPDFIRFHKLFDDDRNNCE